MQQIERRLGELKVYPVYRTDPGYRQRRRSRPGQLPARNPAPTELNPLCIWLSFHKPQGGARLKSGLK